MEQPYPAPERPVGYGAWNEAHAQSSRSRARARVTRRAGRTATGAMTAATTAAAAATQANAEKNPENIAYIEKGKSAKAKPFLDKIVRKYPDTSWAVKARVRLRNLD